MKNSEKKIIAILLAIALCLQLGLTGCWKSELKSFELGFTTTRGGAGIGSEFFCGAKSDKVIFDLNNVEIDFYFGWGKFHPNSEPNDYVPDGYVRIGIVAYFYNEEKFVHYAIEYSDYRDIEECYYIKEFTWEEFMIEENAASYTPGFLNIGGKTEFGYHETFTVPAEMFSQSRGVIGFGLSVVFYSEESNLYILSLASMLGTHDDAKLRYEKINDTQIKFF